MYGFISELSVLLIYMSAFMPGAHCFDYFCFVVSFEIEKCEPSNFIYFFQNCLGILGLLQCHVNFGIDLSVSKKKSSGILITIALTLLFSWGSIVLPC